MKYTRQEQLNYDETYNEIYTDLVLSGVDPDEARVQAQDEVDAQMETEWSMLTC